MKGFMLDSNGDVLIQNNSIQMIEGDKLQCQTIKTILNINQGEWFINKSLGIKFNKILGKYVIDKAYYQNEIEQTLKQVDKSLTITRFDCDYDKATRQLKINFTAQNKNGEVLEVTNAWA